LSTPNCSSILRSRQCPVATAVARNFERTSLAARVS
jgi:hypothetical protein